MNIPMLRFPQRCSFYILTDRKCCYYRPDHCLQTELQIVEKQNYDVRIVSKLDNVMLVCQNKLNDKGLKFKKSNCHISYEIDDSIFKSMREVLIFSTLPSFAAFTKMLIMTSYSALLTLFMTS